MKLRYCIECLYPETKPDLTFDADGICSACTAYKRRCEINWMEREAAFAALKAPDAPYDVIVPVSGGKDSTAQVLTCLAYGKRVLAVTAMTDHLSRIGRRNLDNIARLGVDHVMVQTNPNIRRKIARYALTEVGDISWAEHVTIFTVPVQMAVKHGVPFVVWGENSQNQYGGPAWAQSTPELDRRWLEEFGGLLGLRVSDMIDAGVVSEQDMRLYTYPQAAGVRGIFLGHYFPWSGVANAALAERHGWRPTRRKIEGTGFSHENLDNLQTGIHDFFKWIKLGFGRATDMASTAIREGRMTRPEALDHVRRYDGQFPWRYLGVPLRHILSNIDLSVPQFVEIVHKFTNKSLFRVGNDPRPEPLFEPC